MNHSRILVVDDDADIRDGMRVLLEQAGYHVLVASDGQEGLEVAHSAKPDLIITDVSMPRMDGLALLAELRRDVPVGPPPVIVCSAFDGVARQALPLGAACVLPKPFEAEALLRLVDNLLARHPPDLVALERDRSYARSVRERAAEAARRAARRLEEQLQQPSEILAHLVQWVADYFDLAPAAVACVDGDDVRVAAASRDCPVPVDTRLSGEILISTGVLAAKASLVLPDARVLGERPTADGRVLGLGFLVAVPLVFEATPIGVLALCGRQPRALATEDLVSLEALGSYAASMLGPVGAAGNSLGPTLLLETIISSEMTHMHGEPGAFDLLLVSASPDGPGSDWALPLCAANGPRFGVARRNEGTLAIFKRGPDRIATAAAASRALSSLAQRNGSRAAGWVSIVSGNLPLVPANLVVQLASRALDEAQAHPTAPIKCIVLRGEEAPMAGTELE